MVIDRLAVTLATGTEACRRPSVVTQVSAGVSEVTDTPVPDSSECTASENECTNALLAA